LFRSDANADADANTNANADANAATNATTIYVVIDADPCAADGHGSRVEHEHSVDPTTHWKRNRNGFELSGTTAVCTVRAMP
jgi:hypothetical protein